MRGPKFCSEFLRSLRVKSQIEENNFRGLTNGEITWSCLIGHDVCIRAALFSFLN